MGENIYESERNSTAIISRQKYVEDKPVMMDLFTEFFAKVNSLNYTQKINTIYANLTGKKPSAKLDIDKRLNRILYEQEFGKKIQETKKSIKDGKKQFRFPFKWRSIMNKSKKAKRSVLIFYLNIKNEIETPRLYPIYSGNMVIIKNKPYEVDPRAFWTIFGKYKCLLVKEIDRRPVSNLNYTEIKARGDATDSDEFLIKAAMKALVGGVKKPMNKAAIVVGCIALLVVIGFVMMNSGA